MSSSAGMAARGLDRSEFLRKLLHMAVGLIALLVPFLGSVGAALCALVAVVFNVLLLPRLGGRSLWREHEAERGGSLGMVLYPLAVLMLILLFWQRLEVATAVWGILAFGDGMASLVGMAVGGPRLPWNPRKTWAGSASYWLFGSLGATGLYLWTQHHAVGNAAAGNVGPELGLTFVILACSLTALFAAWVESQPLGLDDNISVPLLSGGVLFGLLATHGNWSGLAEEGLGQRALVGGVINLLLALLAYRARSVNRSGAVGGWVLGTAIYAFLDWQGFLHLVAFFVLGTGTTKLGYEQKAKAKLAQEGGGRRSTRHAVANTGVAALLALFAATTSYRDLCLVAFVAAFATAAADTVSSEIGQLWGRRTFLITNLRPVPRGTEGAVSLEGTLAGIAASAVVAILGVLVGLLSWQALPWIVVGAFIGTTLESLAGATLEQRGLLDNEAVNFLNTLVGALAAGLLYFWLG